MSGGFCTETIAYFILRKNEKVKYAMIKEKDIKTGEKVYFKEYLTQKVLCGYIEKIVEGKGVEIREIRDNDTTDVVAYVKFKNIYRNRNDCIKNISIENKIVADYKVLIWKALLHIKTTESGFDVHKIKYKSS